MNVCDILNTWPLSSSGTDVLLDVTNFHLPKSSLFLVICSSVMFYVMRDKDEAALKKLKRAEKKERKQALKLNANGGAK